MENENENEIGIFLLQRGYSTWWSLCQRRKRSVSVAHDLSGARSKCNVRSRDRVGISSRPHWRLRVDAVISDPSFGAGNEDQGSHYTSDGRTYHMDAGGRDH